MQNFKTFTIGFNCYENGVISGMNDFSVMKMKLNSPDNSYSNLLVNLDRTIFHTFRKEPFLYWKYIFGLVF